MKVIVIDETCINGRQSIDFNGIYEVAKHKLKISIKRDSYDFQSKGHISIWNPTELKWNNVYSIPYQKLGCLASNAYGAARKEMFKEDIDKLIDKAKQIIL